jgi:hypothetical protein
MSEIVVECCRTIDSKEVAFIGFRTAKKSGFLPIVRRYSRSSTAKHEASGAGRCAWFHVRITFGVEWDQEVGRVLSPTMCNQIREWCRTVDSKEGTFPLPETKNRLLSCSKQSATSPSNTYMQVPRRNETRAHTLVGLSQRRDGPIAENQEQQQQQQRQRRQQRQPPPSRSMPCRKTLAKAADRDDDGDGGGNGVGRGRGMLGRTPPSERWRQVDGCSRRSAAVVEQCRTIYIGDLRRATAASGGRCRREALHRSREHRFPNRAYLNSTFPVTSHADDAGLR